MEPCMAILPQQFFWKGYCPAREETLGARLQLPELRTDDHKRIPTIANTWPERQDKFSMRRSPSRLYYDAEIWIARTLDKIGPRNCLLQRLTHQKVPPKRLPGQMQTTLCQGSMCHPTSKGSSSAVSCCYLRVLAQMCVISANKGQLLNRALSTTGKESTCNRLQRPAKSGSIAQRSTIPQQITHWHASAVGSALQWCRPQQTMICPLITVAIS